MQTSIQYRRAGLAALGFACWVSAPAEETPELFDPTPLDVTEPAEHWEIPPAPPRSPEESMAMFELPSGFRVEVVAAEPLVQDPIAMTFDERGRIWVLEWPAYNWPLRELFDDLEEKEAPGSRVVILEDTDDDGRMDTRTVFMDDIEWPRGLALHRDGAVLFNLPEIVFARDTTGDGVADSTEVILDGLEIPNNPHLAPSSPVRGMDNSFYSLRTEFRMIERGEGWVLEPHHELNGQWGISQDNYGRLFYGRNEDPLRGNVVPGRYFARNPNTRRSAGVDVRVMHDREVWPHAITPGINRRAQMNEEDGTLRIFTANSGPSIYRGDRFPPEFAGNAFIGETAGQLIRRAVISEEEGRLRAQNAYEQREFLFSNDERFRPVQTATGPDGTLYVADMYRGIIEGHIFVTTFLYNQIRDRGLHKPFNGMGRIYRIVHEEKDPAPLPQIERKSTADWVPLLGHANGFWRDTAQRILVENGDREVVPAVRELALRSENELARLHALWTLEGLDAVDEEVLVESLDDSSFRIRKAGVRVAEPFLDRRRIFIRVAALGKEDRIEVRRQVVLSLGEAASREAEEAMIRILQRDAAEPIFVEAAVSGLYGREKKILDRLLEDDAWAAEEPGRAELIAALAEAVLGAGEQAPVEALLHRIAARSLPQWQQVAILDGFNAADRKVLPARPAGLESLVQSADSDIASRAESLRNELALDEPADSAEVPPGLVDRSFYLKGRAAFAVCGSCHGSEGGGIEGVGPSLTDSEIVSGPQQNLIQIVLEGSDTDPDYPAMTPLGNLSDEEIAAVVYYLRATWGGEGNVVRAEQVREARGAGTQGEEPPQERRPLGSQLLDEERSWEEKRAIVRDHPELAVEMLRELTADIPVGTPEEYDRIPWVWRITHAAGQRNDTAELRAILEIATPATDAPLAHWEAVVLGGGLINGVSQAGAWPGERMEEVIGEDADLRRRWERALTLAKKMAGDEEVPHPTRYDALRMMALLPWDEGGSALVGYLGPDVPEELQMGAVDGLGDIDSPAATSALIEHFDGLTEGNHDRAAEALLRTPERTEALLKALEDGKIQPEALSGEHRQELRDYREP